MGSKTGGGAVLFRIKDAGEGGRCAGGVGFETVEETEGAGRQGLGMSIWTGIEFGGDRGGLVGAIAGAILVGGFFAFTGGLRGGFLGTALLFAMIGGLGGAVIGGLIGALFAGVAGMKTGAIVGASVIGGLMGIVGAILHEPPRKGWPDISP